MIEERMSEGEETEREGYEGQEERRECTYQQKGEW